MTGCTRCPTVSIYARGLCSLCYRRAEERLEFVKKMPRREALAELTHLLDGGVWPPAAARRVGMTVPSARDAAQRVGDTRLARRLTEGNTA